MTDRVRSLKESMFLILLRRVRKYSRRHPRIRKEITIIPTLAIWNRFFRLIKENSLKIPGLKSRFRNRVRKENKMNRYEAGDITARKLSSFLLIIRTLDLLRLYL